LGAAGVAQTGQLERVAIVQDVVDVAEGAAVAQHDAFKLGPAFTAQSVSRCCSDALVESAYFTTAVIFVDPGALDVSCWN
jgi:hypothetical protein